MAMHGVFEMGFSAAVNSCSRNATYCSVASQLIGATPKRCLLGGATNIHHSTCD
jgi:hypothetical protein